MAGTAKRRHRVPPRRGPCRRARQRLRAFARADWDETELLTWGSGWKTFKAFFGYHYRYSPMSALEHDGQPQALGLQKARDTIHERNHLRLWPTPWTYRGEQVSIEEIGHCGFFTPGEASKELEGMKLEGGSRTPRDGSGGEAQGPPGLGGAMQTKLP